ncbi:MAG: rhomboid family intramembrane serine protease, partial [Bacteroidaceae bacterium]|nr:rhomboid family intramembrane serine protease [Bacteroidaceae bacterium]
QEVAQTATYYIEGLNNYQMISDGLNQMSMAAYLSQWTTIGASGACYAILLGFGMTFPNERILLLIPPIPLKAKYFVIGYIVIELVSAFGSQGDSVAHFAHLGGMLFGWIIIRYWRHHDGKQKSGFTSWEEYKPQQDAFGNRLRNKWNEIFGKKKDKDRNNFDDRTDDYDFNARRQAEQKEVDRLLEKIKRSGYDSLTEEEKRKLFDAGKK